MADEQKKSSETMRIDLMPESAHEQSSGPASSLTRMDWTRHRKTPEYVARSRYQELLQSLYDAALVTKLTGEIIDVNARAVEFLRYDRGDLFVMTIYEIISGTDAELMTTLSQNLENERFSLIQAYCMRSDSSYFSAEIAVSRLHLDDVCLCFFIRDISWREEAENKLRLEHQALQITGNGLIITDENCGIQYANPAFARLLGYDDVEGVIERDLGELMQNKQQLVEFVGQVLSDDQTWMIEAAMRGGAEREAYVQISATCNRSEDGEIQGIVFSFADITDHMAVKQEMQDHREELERRVDAQQAEMEKLREAADPELIRPRSKSLVVPNLAKSLGILNRR